MSDYFFETYPENSDTSQGFGPTGNQNEEEYSFESIEAEYEAKARDDKLESEVEKDKE